jgi:GT2 family glycosyltransferase/glycosyltransferase involved in cell wall biosynthesis
MADASVPAVFAIVVNHERTEATVRCVHSLLESDGVRPAIVVVDSGSVDDPTATLSAIPGVTVLAMRENRGYAAALNVGIEHGLDRGADTFWLLNNDVLVAADALSQALRAASDVDRPGVVASTQLVPRPGARDPFAGTPYPCATRHGILRDRHFACDGSCDGPGVHPADVVTGAALLVTADLVRTVGKLDEGFFHYGEEDDYSERARAAGFVNLLACRSQVSHQQGLTLPMGDPQAEYYRLRNLFLLRRALTGRSPLTVLAHPGYAKAIAATWSRLRSDERSRLAFRSGLRHGLAGRRGRVRLPRPATSRPARLMIVTHSAGGYGAERSLLAMLAGLPHDELQPLVVVPRPGPLTERLAAVGIPCLIIPNRAWLGRRTGPLATIVRFWSTLPATWRLARLIRTAGIDIVASWTLGVTAGAFAARLTGRPHVWFAHELLSGNGSMRGPLPGGAWLRLVERLSDVVVSVSTAALRQFPESTSARHVVIPNALPAAPAAMAEERGSRERPSGGRHRVVVVGAVAPHKRTIDAVRAFEVLRKTHPDAELRIWGDGPPRYRRAVRAEAARLGLDGSVRFEGFEPDPAVYLDADLMLAPSYPESFGLAVLEAMAAGLPVVAARSDGLAELVGPDGAVLVAPGDWGSMAAEAVRLLDDEGRYQQVAAAAKARAAAFTPRGERSPYADVFREVIGRRR